MPRRKKEEDLAPGALDGALVAGKNPIRNPLSIKISGKNWTRSIRSATSNGNGSKVITAMLGMKRLMN